MMAETPADHGLARAKKIPALKRFHIKTGSPDKYLPSKTRKLKKTSRGLWLTSVGCASLLKFSKCAVIRVCVVKLGHTGRVFSLNSFLVKWYSEDLFFYKYSPCPSTFYLSLYPFCFLSYSAVPLRGIGSGPETTQQTWDPQRNGCRAARLLKSLLWISRIKRNTWRSTSRPSRRASPYRCGRSTALTPQAHLLTRLKQCSKQNEQ